MRTLILAAIGAAIFWSVSSTAASAQLGNAHFKAWDNQSRSPTRSVRQRKATKRSARSVPRRYSPSIARTFVAETLSSASRILPHPSGCPRVAFCGCGASVEVFGRPVRSLFLAANWLKFPKASPGPGMVAARRGHVMVIRKYLGNNKALVYDANSGGRQTRLHVRSLAGFSIRNPRS